MGWGGLAPSVVEAAEVVRNRNIGEWIVEVWNETAPRSFVISVG